MRLAGFVLLFRVVHKGLSLPFFRILRIVRPFEAFNNLIDYTLLTAGNLYVGFAQHLAYNRIKTSRQDGVYAILHKYLCE